MKADLLQYTLTGWDYEYDWEGHYGVTIGSPVTYTFSVDLDRQGYISVLGVETMVSGSFYAEFADDVWFGGYVDVMPEESALDVWSCRYATATTISTGIWT